MGARRAREAAHSCGATTTARSATFTFADISRLSNRAANAFTQAGHRQGRRGHDDPAPPLGVLGVRRGAVQAGRHHHPCVVAAHEEGHRVPRQLRAGEGDGVRERRLRVRPDRGARCPTRPPSSTACIVAGERDGWTSVRRARRRRARRVRAAHGRGGRHEQGHHARLLHVRHHGQPQGRVRTTSRTRLGHIITAKYWQQVQEDTLHMSVTDSGWAKFGWGKIYGQWICRRHHLRLRHGQVRARRSCCRRSRTTGSTTFCAPPTMYRFMLQEDVASYRPFERRRTSRRRASRSTPRSRIAWEQPDRQEDPRGLRPDGRPACCWRRSPWVEPRPGSMGKPCAAAEREAARRRGQRGAPTASEGAICVTGLKEAYPPGLFVGYYQRRRDERARPWAAAYYNLHDMAWRDYGRLLLLRGPQRRRHQVLGLPHRARSRWKARSSSIPPSSSAPSPLRPTPSAARWSRPPSCWRRARSPPTSSSRSCRTM